MFALTFRYYSGLANQDLRRDQSLWTGDAELTRCANPSACGGQIIPWNGPLSSASWKIAPALGVRQHRGAEARRAKRRLQPSVWPIAAGKRALPPGVRQLSSPGSGETAGAGFGRAPGCRQDRVHRLDGRRQRKIVRAGRRAR